MKTATLLVLMLSACATQPDYMDLWVGRSSEELLIKWGAPDSRMPTNGKQIWTWVNQTIDQNHQGETNLATCRRSFLIANGRVEKWSRVECREEKSLITLNPNRKHPLAP